MSTLSPLKAMQIATTRKSPGKPHAAALLPKECVSLGEILAAYTTGGSRANYSYDTGRLVPGMAADFIVLDRNIFAAPLEKLGEARVVKTFLDGKLVFDRTRPEDRDVHE